MNVIRKRKKMTLGRLIIESAVVLLVLAQLSRSLEISDFYDYDRSVRLENGADKYEFVQLDTPIYFYSDVHDHIYVSALAFLHAIPPYSLKPF